MTQHVCTQKAMTESTHSEKDIEQAHSIQCSALTKMTHCAVLRAHTTMSRRTFANDEEATHCISKTMKKMMSVSFCDENFHTSVDVDIEGLMMMAEHKNESSNFECNFEVQTEVVNESLMIENFRATTLLFL